jgi:hypothetical protein
MPAIVPEHLETQIEIVQRAFGNPQLLVRRIVELLEFYADRTRRPTRAREGENVPWAFGAPLPVLRALKKALLAGGGGDSETVWAVGEALWQAGYRETQVLATQLIGVHADERVALWAEEKAPSAVDGMALASLGGEGLERWRAEQGPGFLVRVDGWIQSGDAKLRALGLAAVAQALEDPDFEDIPSVFPLLRGLTESAQGEGRRQLGRATRALAKRSPPEAARFLREERMRCGERAHWLVRASLDAFPVRMRDNLRRTLSRL